MTVSIEICNATDGIAGRWTGGHRRVILPPGEQLQRPSGVQAVSLLINVGLLPERPETAFISRSEQRASARVGLLCESLTDDLVGRTASRVMCIWGYAMIDTNVRYYSKFGGLWIDKEDRQEVERVLSNIPDSALQRDIRSFERDGFVVLEQAVPHEDIDRYREEFQFAADHTVEMLMTRRDKPGRFQFDGSAAKQPGSKILDTAMLMESGHKLSFAPRVSQFLRALFEGPALAFQSLHFEVGSTQAIHQDTAYVVVNETPLQLIASWIALEDIVAGSGELTYYVGGHRLREHLYDEGESKHFSRPRDGAEPHLAHLKYLHEESRRLGLHKQSFAARKGDVLMWHSDLPHGGGPITVQGVTRRALVTHYCPIAATPRYFAKFTPERCQKVHTSSGDAMVSWFYEAKRFQSVRVRETAE